ncbi:MAG: HNH endonuclease [Acidobacteriota bacterium]
MANNWTRKQLIIVFNLYCKIPFSKTVKTYPEVIKTAKLIGRTPSAVAFKLGNFGSFDEELKKRGISGLPNTSKLDKLVWDEFNSDWEELSFQSELLIAELENKPIEETVEIDLTNLPIGKERERLVKVRVNQSFFRSTILTSYASKCCITGLNIPELLVASHIKPWKDDSENRTNPQNGLCLNSLHDKAFDRGFITVTTDYKVKTSKYFDEFNSQVNKEFFTKYEGFVITLPEKFLPKKEFLEYHYEVVFKK